jgi:hypothetical protein
MRHGAKHSLHVGRVHTGRRDFDNGTSARPREDKRTDRKLEFLQSCSRTGAQSIRRDSFQDGRGKVHDRVLFLVEDLSQAPPLRSRWISSLLMWSASIIKMRQTAVIEKYRGRK